MKTNWLTTGLALLAGTMAAQAQFDYIAYNGTAIITGYYGPAGPVTIPTNLGGLPVVEIQGSGFEDKGITSVAIPDTVTNIEVQEFAPNTSLTNFTVDSNNPAFSSSNGVLFDKTGTLLFEYPPGLAGSYVIPSNVTSVGQNAFAACYYLSGITIPDSVTNIGPTGFGYCFDLTSVTVPASVTGIGPDAFINCDNLPAISVASSNPAYTSVGGVLFDHAMTTLLEYPTALSGNYAVPTGVTTIGTNAFILCDGLTGVTIPASVQNITDGAFADCAGLTNVTLGAGVSYLATTAFFGCNQLLAINVDPANPNFSSFNGVVFNENKTTLVLFPTGFTNAYTVPASVTSIADYAFNDCNVAAVTIPGNVASIGFESFQGCGDLTNVTMANGVSSIGEFAFGDCPELATVTIPATVTNLLYGTFAYCNFGAVYFQGNAPTADPQAFLGDSGTVYYEAGTSGWSNTFDGLTTSIENAPNPNGALQVTINPSEVVTAGAQWQVDGGFLQPSGATVLGLSVGPHAVSFTTASGWITPSNQSVSIIANATNTVSGMYQAQPAPPSDFVFVTNAGTITITGYTGPGGFVLIPSTINSLAVNSIAGQAFANISTLTGVTIPDTVTDLGDLAFSSCTALADVTISAGVTNIGIAVFEDCFSLSAVTFRGPVASFGDSAFASCFALTAMNIPATVTNIGPNVFYGGGLTNIFISAALTTIGEGAFLDCTHLPAIMVDPANPAYTSVAGVLFIKSQAELVEYPDGNPATSYIISNGVTDIADEAFEYSPLASVTISGSVTNIGNSAFESCYFLTNAAIPPGVVSIGETAFGFCYGLSNAFIPASVTSLGEIPFVFCLNMTAINVDPDDPAYASAGGVLYNKSATQLLEYPCGVGGSFAIPNGVGDIASQAFEECQLTNVSIPPSVTNIEEFGFFEALVLQSVTGMSGLRSMGIAAFEDCFDLTNIVLSSTLTNVGDYAFAFSEANPVAAYFEGNAPPDDGTVFSGDTNARVYYLPGATGWGPTFGTAPTIELTGITATASPTNGQAPQIVNFTASAIDGASNAVLNWNWNFGDGSTIVQQNPSHNYAADGVYTAAVVETNNLGLPIAGATMTIILAPAPPAISEASIDGSNLILDGVNGQTGKTCIVLTSTNPAAPLTQWTPAATNLLSATGNFIITVSNAVNQQFPQRYYILQMH